MILKERRKSTKKVLEERRRGIEMILDSQPVVPDFFSSKFTVIFHKQGKHLHKYLSRTSVHQKT